MITVNVKQIRDHCKRSNQSYFDQYHDRTVNVSGDRHIFIDNDCDVLAVGHIDTVFDHCRDFGRYAVLGDTYIFSPQLDDRLGLYTILDYLPSIGINLDVLLTENEEHGLSTAYDFQTSKSYNWVIEFDRMNLSPVLYQYDTPQIRDGLKSVGLSPSVGSYSDIVELDGLGCVCVNWGIGYIDQHFDTCRVSVGDYLDTMSKFVRFYNRFNKTRFDYTRSPSRSRVRWSRADDDYWYNVYGHGADTPLKVTKPKPDGRTPECLWCGRVDDTVDYYDDFECYLCVDCADVWNDRDYSDRFLSHHRMTDG